MHADLVKALKKTAKVELIAAFKDQRLGFPNPDAIRVFFPDIHLITKKRQKAGKFKFGANHTDMFVEVLGAVKRFKVAAKKTKQEVLVHHLGDLLDVWREDPTANNIDNVVTAIEDDYGELIAALTDPKLDMQFLLGNHDFDLFRLTNYRQWERRFYVPDYKAPTGIVLHGDIFSWIEKLPDALQQLFVYYFAPQVSPGHFNTGQKAADRFIDRFNGTQDYSNYIQAPQPLRIGIFGDAVTPAPFNVYDGKDGPADKTKYLDQARTLCTKANKDFGINLNFAVIGHTHHPRITYRDDGDGLFVLVDCGAWIEYVCTDADPTGIESAQVTALSGNEIRIYQLSPKA